MRLNLTGERLGKRYLKNIEKVIDEIVESREQKALYNELLRVRV